MTVITIIRSFYKEVLLLAVIASSTDMAAQGPTVNYVRTWDATAPIADANELLTRPLKDVKMSTHYLDGLGRPLQTVIREGSLETGGSATDIVKQVVYDEFGRETYKYLPYAASGTGSTDGMYKSNALVQQNAFYSDPNGVLKGQNESFFYGKTNYEASFSGRVEKSLPPGVNWVGSDRGGY